MPKIVSVNVLGFPEKDRRMIRNILSVAGNQEAVYKWTTENSEVADIFVVNANDGLFHDVCVLSFLIYG